MSDGDVLVFCEGPRDLRLIETYYEETAPGVSVIPFDGNDLQYSTLKRQESDRIGSFVGRRWGDVLVKSEGSVHDLRKAFSDLLRMLIDRQPRICLLIDFDTGPSGSVRTRRRHRMGKFDERVRDKHGEQYGIELADRVDRSGELTAYQYRLTADYGNTGPFWVLGFHESLEAAAGIEDHHSEEAEADRLREFVTDRAAAPMRAVL